MNLFQLCLLSTAVALEATEIRVDPINVVHPSHAARITGAGDSWAPILRSGGSLVYFTSTASDLVDNDANGTRSDVFRRDMTTGQTELLSLGPVGQPGDGASLLLDVSADGNRILFSSGSANFTSNSVPVPGGQLYVRDLQARTTVLVSATTNGLAEATARSGFFSSDGTAVIFESASDSLTAGDTNASPDVFRRDLVTGRTQCLGVRPDGLPFRLGSERPLASADSRIVVFTGKEPISTNPVTVIPSRLPTSVYRRDAVSGTVVEVTIDTSSSPVWSRVVPAGLRGFSLPEYELSRDGRTLIGLTRSVPVVEGGRTNTWAALVHFDLVTDATTTLAFDSRVPEGDPVGDSAGLSISPDGRSGWVTLTVVGQDGLLTPRIFRWALDQGLSELAGFEFSCDPESSLDGRRQGFIGKASGTEDFLLNVLDPVTGILRALAVSATREFADLSDFAFSEDGLQLAWTSRAGGIVSDDENEAYDVFVTELKTSQTRLVSAARPARPVVLAGGQMPAGSIRLTGPGNEVFFASSNPDLVERGSSTRSTLYVRSIVAEEGRLVGTNSVVTPRSPAESDSGIGDFAVSADGRYLAFQTLSANIIPGLVGDRNRLFVSDRWAASTWQVQTGTNLPIGTSLRFSPDGESLFYLALPQVRQHRLRDRRDLGSPSIGVAPVSQAEPGLRRGTFTYVQSGRMIELEFPSEGSGPVDSRLLTPVPTPFLIRINADASGMVYRQGLDLMFTNRWGGGARRLFAGSSALSFGNVALSPGGNLVAYEVRGAQDTQIHVCFTSSSNAPSVLISRTPSGAPATGRSTRPVISPDGRFVAFASDAPDLVANGTRRVQSVYVADLWTGSLTPVEVPPNLFAMARASSTLTWGPDSRQLAFIATSVNVDGTFNTEAQAILLARLTPMKETDSDSDLLPDGWERAWFGGLERDGTGDADGDGVDDRGEYLAGTWPTHAWSVLRAEVDSERPGEAPVVRWSSVPGVNYRLDRAESLQGPWSPFSILQPGTGGKIASPIVPMGFFRVRAQ